MLKWLCNFKYKHQNDILLCLKEQNTILDVLELQATLIISVRRVWRHIKFCENLFLRPLVLCMPLCLNEFWKNFIWKWRDRNKGKFPRDVYWSRLQKYFNLRSVLTQSGWKGWGVRAKRLPYVVKFCKKIHPHEKKG